MTKYRQSRVFLWARQLSAHARTHARARGSCRAVKQGQANLGASKILPPSRLCSSNHFWIRMSLHQCNLVGGIDREVEIASVYEQTDGRRVGSDVGS